LTTLIPPANFYGVISATGRPSIEFPINKDYSCALTKRWATLRVMITITKVGNLTLSSGLLDAHAEKNVGSIWNTDHIMIIQIILTDLNCKLGSALPRTSEIW